MQQSDFVIEKYWNDLLQAITEDENLRIRKGDMKDLERTDIVEFMGNLSFFEQRMEEKIASLNKIKNKQNG